jgi:hypothetical protein
VPRRGLEYRSAQDEAIPADALEVEWHVQCGDQVVFQLPRSAVRHEADKGMSRHPRGEDLHAVDEGAASAGPDPPQLNPQFVGKQAAERLAKRAARGVTPRSGCECAREGRSCWGRGRFAACPSG